MSYWQERSDLKWVLVVAGTDRKCISEGIVIKTGTEMASAIEEVFDEQGNYMGYWGIEEICSGPHDGLVIRSFCSKDEEDEIPS